MAWSARMAPGKLAYGQKLSFADGAYTFEIEPKQGGKSFATVNSNGSQRGGRPFVAFLGHRVENVEVIMGKDLGPVVTDDFILVPRPPECDPGRDYRVVFRATRVR